MFNKPALDYFTKVLSIYKDSESVIRQRAKCLYGFSIAILFFTLLFVLKSVFFSSYFNINNTLNYPVIFIWSAGAASFLYTLILLKNGNYKLSSALFLATLVFITWFTFLFTDSNSVSRIDLIPLIFAALGIMPLFIEKRKYLILLNLIGGISFFVIIGFLPGVDLLQKKDALAGFVLSFSFVLVFIFLSGDSILLLIQSFLAVPSERKIQPEKDADSFTPGGDFSRKILENLPIGVGIVNTQGSIVYINPSFTKIFGYTLNDIPDYNTWLEKSYPDPAYRVRVAKQWADSLLVAREKPETDNPPEEYIIFSKEGRPKNIEINFSLVGNEVYTTFNDVSDVRHAEEKYRSLFENTGTGFVVIEENGTISLANNSFVEKLGYTRDELENKIRLSDLIYEDDLVVVNDLSSFFQLKENKQKLYYEFRMKRRDGSIRNYSTYFSGVYGANKITASLNDITEQKKARDEIVESEKRAVAQRAAISNILLNKALIVDDNLEAMKQIIKIATGVIGTARGSIWSLNEEQLVLHCDLLYNAELDEYSSGATLNPQSFPNYFEALRLKNRIYANDAVNDYRTNAMAEDYLIPLGITSLLDSCIMTEGRITGIVSFEHIGPLRNWHPDEESFVSNLASILAQFKEKIEHKKTGLALRDSEERFRSVMEQSPFSMMIISPNGSVQYANKAYADLWGGDPLLYKDYNLFEDPRLKKLDLVDQIKDIVKGEDLNLAAVEFDLNNLLGNGVQKFIQGHCYPVKGADNKLKYIILIYQDITERVKAELEVKKSRELFRSLMELNPNAISVVDMQGRYQMVNKTFCKYANLAAEDIIGKTAKEIGFSGSLNDNKKIMDDLFTNGFIENFEMSVKQNDKVFNLVTFASMVEIDGQKKILTTRFDITERKKLEEKLLESENLLRMIVDMVPYSIVIHDENNKYTFANKAFLKYYDLNYEEIIGKTAKQVGIIIKDEDYKRIYSEFDEKGFVDSFELYITRPNGQGFYIMVSMRKFEMNGKSQMIVTSVNITERKMLEQKLIEYNLQLEDKVKERTEELSDTLYKLKQSNDEQQVINEMLIKQRNELEDTLIKLNEAQEQLIQTEKMASLGILTAGVAHEINNPINYVYNGALAIEYYLHDNLPTHYQQLRPFVDAIITGINRTKKIVKSLSKFSHKDSTNFVKCNIKDILDNCLTMLYNQYKNRIEIRKEYSPEIPEIIANESTLHQAFINILSNAVQSIENNGEIIIKINVENDFIIIHFTDTGVGISEENMKHIYDPFFTTKNPGEGTGLGLSITKRIILEHSGTIQCKSVLNKGSEFIIKLPFKGKNE